MKDAKGTWISRKVKSGDEFVLIFGHRKQKAKLKSLAVGENTYHDQDSYICLGELAFTLLPEHDKLHRLSSQYPKKISFCLKIWRPMKSSIMWAVHVNTTAGKWNNSMREESTISGHGGHLRMRKEDTSKY